MTRFSYLLAALLLAFGVAATGCSDDTTDATTDTGGDTGGDDDAGGDADDSGGTCGAAVVCSGNSDCEDNEFCDSGCCAEINTPEVCTSQGQTCADGTWSDDNFACVDGACLVRCETDSDDAGGCPIGSACFGLNEPPEDIPEDGVCVQGDCNDSCFDANDCDADDMYVCACADAGVFSCDGTNGTCQPGENGASYCTGGGSADVGDDCDGDEAASTCAAGLLCLLGECILPCDSNDSDACGNDECVQAFPESGDNAPGVCGASCSPFSQGACGENQRCESIIGNSGIQAWLCLDMEDLPVSGLNEACDPDGEDDQCAEGHICSDLPDDSGICVQLCDATLGLDAALARCLDVAPGAPVFGDAAYYSSGESNSYEAVDDIELAGDVHVVIEPDGEDDPAVLLASRNDLFEDAFNAVISYYDPVGTADALVQDLVWDGDTAALTTDASGLRVYNLSDDGVSIHMSIDDDDVGPIDDGASTGYELIDEDTVWAGPENPEFHGADRSAYAATEIVVFSGGEASDWSAWFPVDVAAPDTGDYAIRVINASTTTDTIFVDFSGGADNDADVDYGEGTEWSSYPSAGTDVDILIGPGVGGDRLYEMLAEDGLTDGAIVTVLLVDGEADAEIIVLTHDISAVDTGEGDHIARITNVTGAELTSYHFASEWAALTASELPSATGVDEIDAGDYGVVLALTDTASYLEGDRPEAWDDLTTIANEIRLLSVYEDDSSVLTWGLTDSMGVPDLGALTADQGWIIFSNYTSGSVRLDFPGQALQVCAPSSVDDIGLCNYPCNAYTGEPLFDEDGDLLNRYETNGCPGNDDSDQAIVYACIGYTTNGDDSVAWEDDGLPDFGGYCIARLRADAVRDFGESCVTQVDGQATAADSVCNPDAFCVPSSDTEAECLKLCMPFSGAGPSDCIDDTVCINGSLSQSVGLCLSVDDVVDAAAGEVCPPNSDFRFCNADDAFCFSATQGGNASCTVLCKKGFDETCPEGQVCSTDPLFIEPFGWVGSCVSE